MFSLIERFERMGRRGAVPALALAAVLVLLAVALLGGTLLFQVPSGWGERGLQFVGVMSGAFGMVYGMIGARLLTARTYPSVEEVFPSLSELEFARAVRHEERPICVCARCRIYLPAEFSTGACPRCESSVDYYQIDTDEDADMVLLAVRQ